MFYDGLVVKSNLAYGSEELIVILLVTNVVIRKKICNMFLGIAR